MAVPFLLLAPGIFGSFCRKTGTGQHISFVQELQKEAELSEPILLEAKTERTPFARDAQQAIGTFQTENLSHSNRSMRPQTLHFLRESETTIKKKFALCRGGWAGGQGGKLSKTLFFMGNVMTIKF